MKLFHVVLDNRKRKMYDLHMDTENELAESAYRDRFGETRIRYACAIEKCDSALVDEVTDLNLCEKCRRRVCDGHNRKRSVYGVCETCDKSERGALAVLLTDELTDLAGKIQARLLTAEDVILKLEAMVLNVEEIEGQD